MAIRDLVLVLVVVCLSLSHNGFGESTLSKEEDLELENELKQLNKPGVKTIKTVLGDTYTCVEFHKQPAFDHPALKNFTFNPFEFEKQDSTKMEEMQKIVTKMWVNGKGCPIGTVPIRKMSKENLIKAKLANQIMFSEINPLTGINPGYHYAVTRINDRSRQLHGAGMWASVYNPTASERQFSRGYMELRNGAERIATGWMVNPSLYNDKHTRAFTVTSNADGSTCFNLLCSGLVAVRPDIPVDYLFPFTTERGGSIPYEVKFGISQDMNTKNWLLRYLEYDAVIAYWPAQIFSKLNDHADYVEWGGAVYSPPDVYSPPMGSSGHNLILDHQYDAYCRDMRIVNENYEIKSVEKSEKFEDISTIYHVLYDGIVGGGSDIMYYGGLGLYLGN